MRAVLLGASLLAATLALGACGPKGEAAKPGEAAPTAGAEAEAEKPGVTAPPIRKAGQWEHRMTASGQSMTMKICLDEATEKRISWWGKQYKQDDCDTQEVTPLPNGGGWSFHSVCKTAGGGTTTTSGAASGDFQKAYTVQFVSKTTGAPTAALNGESEMKIDAEYKGPCPGGQRGGDVVLPNGMTMNILEMGQNMLGGGK